jgi:putative membrane protein
MRRISVMVFVPLALTAGCSKPLDPKEFLTKAIQGDNSEMTLGGLAAIKGGPAVSEYGRTLVADHTKAKASAAAVASRNGVEPPSDMLPEASKERTKLDGLSGKDFDKEFASYMVKDHKEDISDFEKEAASNAPADVKKLAQDTLPDLRKHLEMAQRLN